MPTRKHQQSFRGFDYDPDLQQGPKPQRKRRRQINDVGDHATFFETPYFGGQMMTPGPAPVNGDGIQPGFIKREPPSGSSYMPRRRTEPPIIVAGHGLLELGLEIPSVLDNEEIVRRRMAVLEELRHQRDNAPRLPPSKVADLPPKEELPAYIEIPPGLDPESRKLLEEENNRISKLSQDMDRERNNLAAKKSRSLRLEDLAGYRELCAQATAKVFFHRLVDIASGRDPDSWERLPENIRADLVAVIRKAVKKGEDERAAKKKAVDAQVRTQRVHDKKALHAAAAGLSPSSEQTGAFSAYDGFENCFEVETPDRDL